MEIGGIIPQSILLLSYLISSILNHLADKMNQGTECRSTKEMIAAFEEVNSHNGLTNLIVGSMDVNVLYPGLLADETAIREEFENTVIKIEGVNWTEAGKLLAICLDKEEIERLGQEELVCRRKKEGNRGRKIGITTAEIMGKLYKEEEKVQDVSSLFDPPSRLPTSDEEKKVFAKVLELMIVSVMKHHVHQFSGRRRWPDAIGTLLLNRPCLHAVMGQTTPPFCLRKRSQTPLVLQIH